MSATRIHGGFVQGSDPIKRIGIATVASHVENYLTSLVRSSTRVSRRDIHLSTARGLRPLLLGGIKSGTVTGLGCSACAVHSAAVALPTTNVSSRWRFS